jgi:hypothetical protein
MVAHSQGWGKNGVDGSGQQTKFNISYIVNVQKVMVRPRPPSWIVAQLSPLQPGHACSDLISSVFS